MTGEKIVLGLSDGVDSAAAAHLLLRAGYDVRALYMDTGTQKERRGAQESADEAGIPLRVVDVREMMEERVCGPFAREYAAGRTPSPCLVCNPRVKIPLLLAYADEIGAEKAATGHYARCDGKYLYKGKPSCDQSYMLSRLAPGQLARLLLPLGGYEKDEVRRIAREAGYPARDRPDSRENCFIRGETYVEWLEKRIPAPPEGPVYYEGRRIACHRGIHRYTVGQRWGETKEGRRLYVSRIDSADGSLTVCLWEGLFTTEILAEDMAWAGGEAPEAPLRASVRVRHTRWEEPACTVYPLEGGRARAVTDEPLRAPAPGQTAVFYSGDRVVGAGVLAG